MQTINPAKLKKHPQNHAIYGNEDITELRDSIASHGMSEPIVVSQDYVVVSGHRRLQVALELGLAEVPIIIKEYEDEHAMLEALLLANQYRAKTTRQIHAEIDMWVIIEAGKAKRRMLATQNNEKARAASEPGSLAGERGRATDLAAARFGISGRSYEQGKPVRALISKAPEPVAEALATVFEQSVKTAALVAKEPPQVAIEVARLITEEEKSADAAYKQVKKEERQTEKEIKRIEQIEIGKQSISPDNVNLIHADFTTDWKTRFDAESVDIIITDPPYHERYLHLWEHLGEMAAHVLKPHGLLVAYSGQSFLPQVFASVGNHLNYVWTIATYHNSGFTQIWKLQLLNAWKPIVIWSKGDYVPTDSWITDFMGKGGKEKDLHDWAQPLSEAKHLVKLFTKPGDVLVDPMMGSGTIPIAAYLHGGLTVWGMDIEEQHVLVAKGRLHDHTMAR